MAVRRTRRRDDIIFVVRHDNPAQLVEPDPGWAAKAAALLAEIQGVMVGLDGADRAAYDHIGSTSVQGLAAKPYLDLQIRILPLPSHDDLTARLGSLGFDQAHGSRRNSPGVTYDLPAPGDDDLPDEVWPVFVAWAHARRPRPVVECDPDGED